MAKAIWISYDLGVDGDYDGIYYWLDKHRAKECGDSTAYLKYEFKNNILKEIQDELTLDVKIRSKDRIYIIFYDGKSYKGKFLFGSRKRSAWEGYSEFSEDIEDES